MKLHVGFSPHSPILSYTCVTSYDYFPFSDFLFLPNAVYFCFAWLRYFWGPFVFLNKGSLAFVLG